MIENTLGLFITVVFITFLLVAIGLSAAWRWELKAAVIVFSTGVMISCYFSLVGLLGWPTPFNAGDPEQVLIHAFVEEPEKTVSAGGSIYLWVRSNEKGSTPRALYFPYRRELHETVIAALQRKNGGTSQGVRLSGNDPGGARNDSFSMFDMYKPRLTDKNQREN